MKKVISFFLILSLSLAIFSLNNLCYAKTNVELNYSSKKVVKVTKIKRTYEILEWFNGLGSLNCDYEDSYEKYNSYAGWNMTYHKVIDKRFSNMRELKTYLKKYLSSSYIKKLLKQENFVEKNEKLYYGTGERGANITYISSKYKITKKTSKKRIIKVTNKYWDNYEYYPKKIKKKIQYFKQKKINEKWVFTKISLPY